MHRLAILTFVAAISACAMSRGEFTVVLNQYEYPIGFLRDYRGANAYAIIEKHIREWCDGAFDELGRTASEDGADHGITFECKTKRP